MYDSHVSPTLNCSLRTIIRNLSLFLHSISTCLKGQTESAHDFKNPENTTLFALRYIVVATE